MRSFAKAMLIVNAGVFVSLVLQLTAGRLIPLKLLNDDCFRLGFVVLLFGVAVVEMMGLILCGLRRDWRNAVVLLAALAVLAMTQLVYGILLLGSFA